MARAAPYDRDKTLDAAMSLFWDKGYHATSLKDLEGALEMKPGSIYAAYKSKENLYLLAMERYFERFRGQFRDQIAQAPSPLQGLAGHLRGYAGLLPDDAKCQACMLLKTFVDTRTTEPAIAAQSQAYLDAMRHEIALAFQAAAAQGQVPENSDFNALARQFQAYVNALRLELHQGTAAKDLSVLTETMAQQIEALGLLAS
ncbi:TetR/AcrR family transcriptional regulator [Leisingera sp. XS_AS12]|jgi:AcrR family transcriptional regulator|uniref:TetR/AcrR family transcriptional regulator n=1 Tax=Leisingera sp. XS_AS12 TaxID=3241294 RepID=UPI00351241CD